MKIDICLNVFAKAELFFGCCSLRNSAFTNDINYLVQNRECVHATIVDLWLVVATWCAKQGVPKICLPFFWWKQTS